MDKIVVLDTNVLLADPNVVLSYPREEVVIPETVLGELDKLKTARVDPDLRFRGREVSRILFDLSEEGSLVEGVDLPDGGRLRVVPFDGAPSLPEGMSTRNADDRILATAYHVHRDAPEGTEVSLVTNDLNMLLKAQTMGIPVERHDGGVEASFGRRYVLKPLQRYKVPIGILAIALAVFAAVIVIAIYAQRTTSKASLPPEFKSLLSTQQQSALDALISLQASPNEPESLLKMANFYFDAASTLLQTDPVSALNYGRQGIRYYQRYLDVSPKDNDARADYASLLFYTGQTDRAIQEVSTVLESDANHINANYNLGIFYGQGRRDYPAAIAQMQKVIALTKDDPQQHGVYQQAVAVLEQLQAAAKGSSAASGTTGALQ